MKLMKSKAGFTLVELLVVIAILGILAGIAVPAYSGYIKKANSAKDTQFLSAVYTAAVSACAEKGNVTNISISAASGDVNSITATTDAATNSTVNLYIKGTDDDQDDNPDFMTYIGSGIDESAKELVADDTYAAGATWSDGKWTAGGSSDQD